MFDRTTRFTEQLFMYNEDGRRIQSEDEQPKSLCSMVSW